MGKAGKALNKVLKTYKISQNRLALIIGTGRSNVYRWVAEVADPGGDSILEIRDALEIINPAAAREFTRLYWGRAIDPEEPEG